MSNTSCNPDNTNSSAAVCHDLDDVTEQNGNPSDVTNQTDVSSLIFLSSVVIIGVVGLLANGFVLLALMNKKLRRQTSNILTINQVFIDLIACLSVIISYALRIVIVNIPFFGTLGDFVCMIFMREGWCYMMIEASITNLQMIAIERYLKIVHPVKYRNYFRRWMLFAACAFVTMLNVLISSVPFWMSPSVIDDQCYWYLPWPGHASETVYAVFTVIWFYLFPLITFVYCYGRIVMQLRSRFKVSIITVTTATNTTSTTCQSVAKPAQQEQSNKSEANVIKTMIIISVAFLLTNFIDSVGYVVYMFVSIPDDIVTEIFCLKFISEFLRYINICLDPFVYAFSHSAIKNQLRAMLKDRSGKGSFTKESERTGHNTVGTTQE